MVGGPIEAWAEAISSEWDCTMSVTRCEPNGSEHAGGVYISRDGGVAKTIGD
jgi:hypothetical protein